MSITIDIAKFFKSLARALRFKCPDKTCTGRLKSSFIDEHYLTVYVCDTCGKEWI
jgi:hypothetical protein